MSTDQIKAKPKPKPRLAFKHDYYHYAQFRGLESKRWGEVAHALSSITADPNPSWGDTGFTEVGMPMYIYSAFCGNFAIAPNAKLLDYDSPLPPCTSCVREIRSRGGFHA